MDNPETLATLGTGYRTNTNNPPPLFPKKKTKIKSQHKTKTKITQKTKKIKTGHRQPKKIKNKILR